MIIDEHHHCFAACLEPVIDVAYSNGVAIAFMVVNMGLLVLVVMVTVYIRSNANHPIVKGTSLEFSLVV